MTNSICLARQWQAINEINNAFLGCLHLKIGDFLGVNKLLMEISRCNDYQTFAVFLFLVSSIGCAVKPFNGADIENS